MSKVKLFSYLNFFLICRMNGVIHLNSKLANGEKINFLRSRKVENVSMIGTVRYLKYNDVLTKFFKYILFF